MEILLIIFLILNSQKKKVIYKNNEKINSLKMTFNKNCATCKDCQKQFKTISLYNHQFTYFYTMFQNPQNPIINKNIII